MLRNFHHFEGLNVSIHTNTNCVLKCSYCYENDKAADVGEDGNFWSKTAFKDEKRNYDFVKKPCVRPIVDVAQCKVFIDNVLEYYKTDFFKEFCTQFPEGIVLDFIGGDSLQYPELMDEIITHFVRRLMETNHPWMYNWKVSCSSNGVTFLNPKVIELCKKWRGNLSIGISIDGCPELHDLNRWCFADNEDGSHRGSWKYIESIWPWYKKNFEFDSLRTKWTLAPNSYRYIFKSIKFLHEEMKMNFLMFNRVMENEIQDTAADLKVLIEQFELAASYLIDHHYDLYLSPFAFQNTTCKTKKDQLKEDPDWSRCGFGRMPTLSVDGNVYPCFRMLPGNNHIENAAEFAQGTYDDLLKNEETLRALNVNSRAANMEIEDKCMDCRFFSTCPHCAADCVQPNKILRKTSSVCYFTKIEVYFARKYWAEIVRLHPTLYSNQRIDWTEKDQEELMAEIQEDIVKLQKGDDE